MQIEELVEAAARRMAVADGQNPDKLSHNSFEWWRHYVPMARAAIEATLSAAEPVGEVAGQQGRYWMTDEGRWSNWFDITFNTWVPEPGVREVRNLYAAPPAPSVAVKELEWSPRNDQPQYEVCADTPFGRYKTSNKGEYGFGWMQPRQTVWSGFLPTLEEAKAAAQSHYESRIRSALSAQVQDVAGDEEWQIVPKHPTGSMIEAVVSMVDDDAPHLFLLNLYRAMLAAAPAKQED